MINDCMRCSLALPLKGVKKESPSPLKGEGWGRGEVSFKTDRRLLCLTFIAATLAFAPAARAADQVHAAKAAGVAWTFTLLNVGIEQGIFAKYGLDVDTADMAGDARLQQALASGAVDFGLGSGPSMALAAKGGQAIAVAAFAGEPRNLAIIVGKD